MSAVGNLGDDFLELEDTDDDSSESASSTHIILRNHIDDAAIFHMDESDDYMGRIRLLKQRNDVLTVLCWGANTETTYVVDAAVRIEAQVRVFILRKDERDFHRILKSVLSLARTKVQHLRFLRMKKSAIEIQCAVRGFLTRRLTVCKALATIKELRRELMSLELVLLRMGYPDLHCVPRR